MKKLKKVVGVVIVMLCVQTTYSQARLGYSLAEISEEFGSDKTFISGFPNESWVSVGFSTALVYYSFNEKKECSETFVSPYTEEDVHYYINKYNDDYKKTSNTTWVIVDANFNIYISLKKTDEGVIFFTWTY